MSDSLFFGRVTVPVIWNLRERRIVNNSKDYICRMLATDFRELAEHPIEFFPEEIAGEQ